jgi:hypothetical protein
MVSDSSVTGLDGSPVKGRRSFSLKYKRLVLNAINDLMLLGYSLRKAAEEVNIPHGYYRNWRRTLAKVDRLKTKETVVPFTITGESRKVHPGRPVEYLPLKTICCIQSLSLGSRGYQ